METNLDAKVSRSIAVVEAALGSATEYVERARQPDAYRALAPLSTPVEFIRNLRGPSRPLARGVLVEFEQFGLDMSNELRRVVRKGPDGRALYNRWNEVARPARNWAQEMWEPTLVACAASIGLPDEYPSHLMWFLVLACTEMFYASPGMGCGIVNLVGEGLWPVSVPRATGDGTWAVDVLDLSDALAVAHRH